MTFITTICPLFAFPFPFPFPFAFAFRFPSYASTMAGVAEAASIAGVISLVGQAVQAASSLYTFLEIYRHLSSRLSDTLAQVSNLQETLEIAVQVLSKASAVTSSEAIILNKLRDTIRECQTDLEASKNALEKHDFRNVKGTTRRLANLKLTADKAFFTNLSTRLSAHKRADQSRAHPVALVHILNIAYSTVN